MGDYTVLDEMPVEDYQYSIASHMAYEYYNNNFEPITTQDELTSMIEGHTLDTELSNDVGVVINTGNKAIIGFRGTDPTNIYDLNADAQLATGIDKLLPLQTRLSRAEDLYNATKNKYNNIELTGHSLGGYLADYIGRKNNEKSVVFNPGLTPVTTHTLPPVGKIKPIVYELDNFDVLSHSVHNRVYSSEVDLRNITQREGLESYIGSHQINSFLPLERITLNTKDTLILPTNNIVEEEPKIDISTSLEICKEQPYLTFCNKKKPKLIKK